MQDRDRRVFKKAELLAIRDRLLAYEFYGALVGLQRNQLPKWLDNLCLARYMVSEIVSEPDELQKIFLCFRKREVKYF